MAVKWEPWMGETAKELYEKGKPENFQINISRALKLRKNDVVYHKSHLNPKGDLYKITEIKEVDHTNPLFLKVSGRWRKLSVMESIEHYEKKKEIVFY